MRRTKIVATLGPASDSGKVLADLLKAGVDVVRLNFSHGTHETHGETFRRVRKTARRLGRYVAVLADLCGPKIRVGKLRGGHAFLDEGRTVEITGADVVGHAGLIPSQYAQIVGDLKAGDPVLLDDGNLELRVLGKRKDRALCRVVQGGLLKEHKGINLPGVAVSTPSVTAKDKDDLRFCLGLGVDYVALSFVRSAQDVAEVKEIVARAGARTPVIAKIEKPEALACIDRILDVADGLMVARGDLGVEMPAAQVPIVQAELLRKGNERNKPVIVATQMLESMIENSRPTRAEVTDVACAVQGGADAVMLSGETAAGKFPVEAVRTMARIAEAIEASMDGARGFPAAAPLDAEHRVPDAVGIAVARLASDLGAACIVALTRTGSTARMLSSDRPRVPLLALSSDEATCRRMALYWGVAPGIVPGHVKPDDYPALAERLARSHGLARDGDYLVLVSQLGARQPQNCGRIQLHHILGRRRSGKKSSRLPVPSSKP